MNMDEGGDHNQGKGKKKYKTNTMRKRMENGKEPLKGKRFG